MKKLLVLLLSIIAAFSAVFALTACKAKGDKDGNVGITGGSESGGSQGGSESGSGESGSGEIEEGSDGLSYELTDDKSGYVVTDIGNCKDKSIIIPSVYNDLPVKSISGEAFYNCNSFTSVTIGNGVTSIGDGAFEYCKALKSVIIPDSVTNIGSEAFKYCISLTSITVGKNNKNYKSVDGNLYSGDGKTLILYTVGKVYASFTVPDGVTSISDSAFEYCKSLKSVTIPDSVTNIGSEAFFSCESLTSIVIPDSVTSIGDSAFHYCISLKSAIIGSGVTNMGAFAFCLSGLTSVTILDGVTNIGAFAFEYCISLTSITIPDSVTSIGYYAFEFCSSLRYTEYENGLYLGNGTNKYLWLMKAKSKDITSCDINGNCKFIYRDAFEECSSLASILIPDGVTSVGQGAFHGCSSLTNVIIPDSVTSIGDSAFYGCSSLQYNEYDSGLYLGNDNNPCVILMKAKDKGVTSCKVNENCKVVYEEAFEECSSLKSVTIPDGVTSIGRNAFRGCSSLTNITIPDSVVSIDDLFYGCRSLKYNEYGNGLYLGNDNNPYVILIKAKSEDITSCDINENCKFIYNSVFYGGSSLTSVTIPDSVTSIGYYAFYDCRSLTSVTYNGTKEQWQIISKVSSWKEDSAIATIKCTDGDITL